MSLNTVIPSMLAILGMRSTGDVVDLCLVSVVVILGIIYAVHQLRRMRRQLRLLDEEDKIHHLRNPSEDDAEHDHQKKDVWI